MALPNILTIIYPLSHLLQWPTPPSFSPLKHLFPLFPFTLLSPVFYYPPLKILSHRTRGSFSFLANKFKDPMLVSTYKGAQVIFASVGLGYRSVMFFTSINLPANFIISVFFIDKWDSIVCGTTFSYLFISWLKSWLFISSPLWIHQQQIWMSIYLCSRKWVLCIYTKEL